MLLIPINMLRAGEETFLDDYTVSKLSQELHVSIAVIDEPGRDFVRNIAFGGGMISQR